MSLETVLRCSFCNQGQSDVKKLIAGPSVYICDECVDICNDILEESGIPAGRGGKAGLRAVNVAQTYRTMAADLARAGNYHGAARELRTAALLLLRGRLLIDGEAATDWPETKVIAAVLEDAAMAALLQVDDTAHVLLRVSIEGAVFNASDIDEAMKVVERLTNAVRAKADVQ